jgi:2-polyprenyl-3-methyl-5-hydroxy-6-metoxy-1,4-benzoquinol methylase
MYELLVNESDKFHNDYNQWRINRVRKMEQVLGRDWFKGKRVLELACGQANISGYLKSIGADVTASDIRIRHLIHAEAMYNVNTLPIDQDKLWTLNERYDLIIHFGVLYHLKNWKQDLACALQHTDMMFLESVVADTNDAYFEHQLAEAEEGGQNAFHGVGTVMSANHVERVIEELGYEWMRFDDPDLNTPNKRLYQYDWTVSNNIAGYEQAQSFEDKPLYGGRRFWLIKKSFASD